VLAVRAPAAIASSLARRMTSVSEFGWATPTLGPQPQLYVLFVPSMDFSRFKNQLLPHQCWPTPAGAVGAARPAI
jgi:hypothetical protein